MAPKKHSISVFFPCYNDSKSIGKLVSNAYKVLPSLTTNYEVIVVDDCSTDKSRDVLINLSAKHNNLKLIFHKKNKGYGGAIKSGFQAASKDLIFYTDGDGQYDVKELPILHMLLTPDADFINGIKLRRGDAWYRVFFGNLHQFINRWAFWLPIIDVDCDFRLIRKNIIKKIRLKRNSGSICIELVKKAERVGAVFHQVTIHHYDRKHGSSEFFKPTKIIDTYIDIIILWIKLMIIDKWK